MLSKRLVLTAVCAAIICIFAIAHQSSVRADGTEAAAIALDAGTVAPVSPTDTQPSPDDAQLSPDDDTQVSPEKIEKDPIGAVQSVIKAWKEKNWKMLVSLVLAALMLALTKVRNMSWSPFKGQRGGAILVALLGLLGGFVAALQSGADIDLKLVLGIMGAVWMAVGGYTWVRDIIWPKSDSKPDPEPVK